MRTVLLGDRPREIEEWLARRHAQGLDLFDEVWEGEYHVAPAAHGRHGDLDQQLAEILGPSAPAAGLRCLGPVNIGSADNYRVPDRVVVRPDVPLAVYLLTAVVVVEILSPDDETFAKFGFYHCHGVDEILVVDPERRAVAWFSHAADEFVERSTSRVLPGVDDLTDRLQWST